jgi:hypothetical protein
MSDLVTPPNGTTVLTSSSTYDNATVSAGSTLIVTGSGTVVTINGTTTLFMSSPTNGVAPAGRINVTNGGDLRILGPISGGLEASGDGATIEVNDAGVLFTLLEFGAYGYNTLATNATVVLDDAASTAQVIGFGAGDRFQFSSLATSFSVQAITPVNSGGYYAVALLNVTEGDGSTVQITLDNVSQVRSEEYTQSYTAANFAIVNGTIVFQATAPLTLPTITGTVAGQAEREGASIQPFGLVTITDANANATDQVVITPSVQNGVLTDPNAASDGFSYNATTGVYTINGTPQGVTQALDGLVFTPNFYTLGQGGSFSTGLSLQITSSTGLTASDSTTTIITYPPLTPDNFSWTGMSDIVMQNVDGAAVIYTTNGLSVTAATSIGNPGPTWHIMGSADFNGDGQPDILLQNDNGDMVDYIMNGTSVVAGYDLGNSGSAWHVRGLGDFNSDGKADIVLQNDAGAMVIQETNGTNLIGGASVGTLPAGWAVEAVADFYGTGRPDILVESNTGTLVEYTMSGLAIASGAVVANLDAGWGVGGTGDYNGDGKADILLHNDNGSDVVLTMNGATATAAIGISNPGIGYNTTVAGIDLNGDGHSDLVVSNAATSTLIGYTLDNTAAITAGTVLGTPGAGWNVVGSNPIAFIDGTGSNLTLAGTPGPDQFNLTSYAVGIHT